MLDMGDIRAAFYEMDHDALLKQKITTGKMKLPTLFRITNDTKRVTLYNAKWEENAIQSGFEDPKKSRAFSWAGNLLRTMTEKDDILLGRIFEIDYNLRTLWPDL